VFYCRIDLSASDSHLCVVDENLTIHLQQKSANVLSRIARPLDPFKPHIKLVVESTFNRAAVAAVRCYPRIRHCYERDLKRHRGGARKLVAYNVIAHKLAQAVYFVLKRGEDYRRELLFGEEADMEAANPDA
jgi:hypothetical protein